MSPGFVAVSRSQGPFHGLTGGLLAREKSHFIQEQLTEPR